MNVVAMKRIKFPKWIDPPVHPANKAPKMSDAEIKELAEDIERHGLQEPIVYWEDNREAANGSEGPFPLYLLDGSNRREALRRNGIDDPRKAKPGDLVQSTIRILHAIRQTSTLGSGGKVTSKWVTDCDPETFHLSMNVYRRHLTPEQRRWEIKKLIARDASATNRSIARKLKVSSKTVRGARFEMTGRTKPRPKAERIAEAIKANPEKGNGKIAKLTGTSRDFVGDIKDGRYGARDPKPTRTKHYAQASGELAAWIIKHADRDELPMVLTWLRNMRIKSVISSIKTHMGEE
jgi:hypothetical protein